MGVINYMSRNYNGLTWYSEERRVHYAKVNASPEKQLGNIGEEIAKKWFRDHGYAIRDTNASDDSSKHVDFYVLINNSWRSVDVKYTKDFYIQLQNEWGKKGWIYTGADYIFQIFSDQSSWDTKTGYFYNRQTMVDFINSNKPLFADKWCKVFTDNRKLWKVYPSRIEKSLQFMNKIYI